MAENKETPIVFARVREDVYIAGVSMDAILADAAGIYPEVPSEDIIQVRECQIPEEYHWSVKRVTEFRDWVDSRNGTYFLIPNFERFHSCWQKYPHLKKEYDKFWGFS